MEKKRKKRFISFTQFEILVKVIMVVTVVLGFIFRNLKGRNNGQSNGNGTPSQANQQ